MYVEYNFFKNSLTVHCSGGKQWTYIRHGISESDVQNTLELSGIVGGIEMLVSKGMLRPVYGGKIKLYE